ncbi:unnamed protein product, partial [Amoebophrya sp. A25]|eukprot:GSA25T00001870001.1
MQRKKKNRKAHEDPLLPPVARGSICASRAEYIYHLSNYKYLFFLVFAFAHTKKSNYKEDDVES